APYLPACASPIDQPLDADGPRAEEEDAGDVGAGDDLGPGGAAEEGIRRAPAPAAPLRHLVVADPLLLGPVEVVGAAEADALAGRQEHFGKRVAVAEVGDAEGAAGAVVAVGPALLIFGAAEVGQHLGEGPAGIAAGRPAVVVAGVAAHVDHGVDGAT